MTGETNGSRSRFSHCKKPVESFYWHHTDNQMIKSLTSQSNKGIHVKSNLTDILIAVLPVSK